MENIFGVGDVEVRKFRDTEISGMSSKWKYSTYSLNRHFKNGERFEERNYEDIPTMAKDIALIFDPTEEVIITPGNSELKVNKGKVLQYSHLDDDELIELAKKIIIQRSIDRIDTI